MDVLKESWRKSSKIITKYSSLTGPLTGQSLHLSPVDSTIPSLSQGKQRGCMDVQADLGLHCLPSNRSLLLFCNSYFTSQSAVYICMQLTYLKPYIQMKISSLLWKRTKYFFHATKSQCTYNFISLNIYSGLSLSQIPRNQNCHFEITVFWGNWS